MDKGLDLYEALPVVRISPVRVMSPEPVKSSGRNATLASGLACFGMAGLVKVYCLVLYIQYLIYMYGAYAQRQFTFMVVR